MLVMFKISKIIFSLIISVTIQSSIAEAEVSNGEINIYGVGSDSCGKLLLAFKDYSPQVQLRHNGAEWGSMSNVYKEWISGYISAYNYFSSNTPDVNNGKDIWGSIEWIHQYCKQNPTELVLEATTSLINFLKKEPTIKPGFLSK